MEKIIFAMYKYLKAYEPKPNAQLQSNSLLALQHGIYRKTFVLYCFPDKINT